MASKSYTLDDRGLCRYIEANRQLDGTAFSQYVAISPPLTATNVKRLRLLNLVDGHANDTTSGELIRLSGLGKKTAKEAVRLSQTVAKAVAVTFTNATNLINATGHGFTDGEQVVLLTTNALPAELNSTTQYYVVSSLANSFQVSLTSGGAAVTFTDDGTGTHHASLVL